MLTKGRTYKALFLNPKIYLNIKISDTTLLPPIMSLASRKLPEVGAKYIKCFYPLITSEDYDKHSACHSNNFEILVCL